MFLSKIKIILLVLIFLVFIFSLINKQNLQIGINNIEKIGQEASLKEMLGSNFVIGFMGTEIDSKTRDIIKDIKPSGIIIYTRNCENGKQLKKLIMDLQEIAREINHQKFFIMIDEEPAGATRINAFRNAFLSGKPDWEIIRQDMEVMSDMGINVDLAPVADYAFNNNSFIKQRIVTETIEDLIYFNNNFIKIAQENNISATLKHFPGMGFFEEDPHKKIPDSEVNQENFKKSLAIFKSSIDVGVDFVMMGHAIYENIDKDITSLSRKIIKDVLVEELGFKGLIITDDMADMPLLVGRKIEMDEATIEAIKAGNNLVLFSHRPENTQDIFYRVLERGQKDPEFREIVKQNYQKIIDFKNKRASYKFFEE